MPQRLTLGSTGPDVSLLQTTLNSRPPTAFPPLVVDGRFGPITLARVKEYQGNNGLEVDGIVGPITWGKLLEPVPAARQTFYTQGRFLFDRLGNKVILRGVNKMSVWDGADPTGATYFAEIRKTRANTVRIVWTMMNAGAPTDLTILDALISNAKNNRLIPMIELHDATGDWNRLQDLVNFWVQPAVVNLVQKHQAYLLVNIGNEVGNDTVTSAQFIAAYTNAIQTLRAAGIRPPLVIDAANWGQNLAILDVSAAALLAADPDHNLLFSVHLYWSIACGNDANSIRMKLQNSVTLGYPLIVGEFSKYGGYPCGQPKGTSICSPGGEIDYQTILETCHTYDIGWYAWEWGPGNSLGNPPDPLCVVMDMTPDGLFANLKAGWAEEVAISSPYSIQNTAVTPPTM